MKFPRGDMGIAEAQPFTATELLAGTERRWKGSCQRLRLDPETNAAMIFRIEQLQS